GPIDLRPYRTDSVRIRFRVRSNAGGTVNDGWYIDDMEVKEMSADPVLTLPFVEGFESGMGNWFRSGLGDDWDSTSMDKRSGQRSVTDSKGVGNNYPASANAGSNQNYFIQLAGSFDLRTSTFPILTYWHRYITEGSFDFCEVQIDTTGGMDWKLLRSYSGTENLWTYSGPIDLRPYRTDSVRIRFRVRSNAGGTVNDGWYIDDMEVKEMSADPVLTLPFVEGFESGMGNWFRSGLGDDWDSTSMDKRSGQRSVTDSKGVGNNYPASANAGSNQNYFIQLAGSFDLRTSTFPILTYWHRYITEGSFDFCEVQIDTTGG